jgi:FkbH-like protein
LWLSARVPLSGKLLNSLAVEYVRYFMAMVSARRKCLVVDLDNTLWGGILGEDGYDGIQIGHEFPGNAFRELQQAVLDLYHRGIILAICSKNNEADVLRVLEQHPDMLLRPQHFASVQINWDDKATNLRRIAQDLNIGLDSLAFWDDNPAERSLVRQMLPEVLVIDLPDHPSEYAPALRRIVEFETLMLSDEDRQRGAMYRAQAERQRLQATAESLESYYASLDMRLEIGLADSHSIPRIAQLTQKTNQFNLTSRRYSQTEIAQMAADPNWRIYGLRLKDRFGDNGLAGVAILRSQDRGTWEIDTFLLSCRILGRTVETAFLAFVLRQAKDAGGTRMEGWFLPTKRNAPAKQFYGQHGFELAKEDESGSLWRLPLGNNAVKIPNWFTIDVKEVLCAND